MKHKICKFILKCMGWTAIEPPVPEAKCIILGVPHTSIWDFVVSYLYYCSVGGKASIIIKSEFFFWPLGFILRSMGGIPVDISKVVTLLLRIIEAFNERESLHLAMAPEGTRKLVKHWKTGFHTIAKAVNVPVYLGYFDWGKKIVGRGQKFELSNNAQEDLKKIRIIYKNMGLIGKHPEKYTTGSDLE
jgi:1-acyl-sn-glycerol-3-phosphate acyltransferase